jgi:hypothetical protein
LEVGKEEQLENLFQMAKKNYAKFHDSTETYYPHASLFYGEFDDLIAKEAEKRGKKFAGQTLALESIGVYEMRGVCSQIPRPSLSLSSRLLLYHTQVAIRKIGFISAAFV